MLSNTHNLLIVFRIQTGSLDVNVDYSWAVGVAHAGTFNVTTILGRPTTGGWAYLPDTRAATQKQGRVGFLNNLVPKDGSNINRLNDAP